MFNKIIILALFSILPLYKTQAAYSFFDEIKSPFVETPSKQIFIYGFGGSLLMYAFLKDPHIIKFQERISKDKPLEHYYDFLDQMGRSVPNIIYAGSFFIHGLLSSSPKSFKKAEVMFKASLYSGAAVTILKQVFRENRPGGSKSKVSYPSGHATIAFAFAGVVSAEHPWYWGLGATTLASLVAVQRMGQNAHYLHDVIAGGALGYSFGWGISRYVSKIKGVSNSNLIIFPNTKGDGAQARYTYNF